MLDDVVSTFSTPRVKIDQPSTALVAAHDVIANHRSSAWVLMYVVQLSTTKLFSLVFLEVHCSFSKLDWLQISRKPNSAATKTTAEVTSSAAAAYVADDSFP